MKPDNSYYLKNESLPTAKTEFEWTPEMVQGLQKAKGDIIYFAENYFHIVNLDRGKEIIKLYKAQKRILKSMVKNNRVILLSSRQAGKTTLITIFALWFTSFNPDKSILIVANKEKTAIEILGRIRLAYELLPNWLKSGTADYSKTDVKFTNGSRIYVSTTASTAGRSSSINCVDGESVITVKDKTTQQIFDIKMKDLAFILENDGIIIPTTMFEDQDQKDS
jgi:hypothetical protein